MMISFKKCHLITQECLQFLQRIYQEDLDELQNEAEYGLNTDRKGAKHVVSVQNYALFICIVFVHFFSFTDVGNKS